MNNMQVLIANSYYSDMPKGLQHEIYKAGFSEGKHSKTSNNHDVLVKRAKLLSGGTEHFVPEEWEMVGVEYRSHPVSCACGKANLKKSYTMKNRSTGYSLSVGGSCLKEYFKQDILGEAMEFLKKGTTGGEGYSWLGSKYDALIIGVAATTLIVVFCIFLPCVNNSYQREGSIHAYCCSARNSCCTICTYWCKYCNARGRRCYYCYH